VGRLESLAAFVAIADQGSFAGAARALRSSPPAMTRAVAGLEERLGVKLLHRSTRSVRLTEQGAVFLERCRRLLADLRDAELGATGETADPHGMLVVTASQMLGRLHVVPIVTELLARHARLDIRLILLDRPIQIVEEGVDVAVRIGDLADSALTAVKLGEVRRVLVASPSYLEKHGAPRTPADLRAHSIVAFTGVSATDEWRFGDAERSTVQVKPRLVINTAGGAIAAVEAGAGIARLLSYQASEGVAAGRLVHVLDEAAPPPTPINLLFQAARGASPNVRAFVEAAKARFS